MERINGSPIRLERLTNDELINLKTHVLHKLDEVMEDHRLVMNEINHRDPQEWQDPLDGFAESLAQGTSIDPSGSLEAPPAHSAI